MKMTPQRLTPEELATIIGHGPSAGHPQWQIGQLLAHIAAVEQEREQIRSALRGYHDSVLPSLATAIRSRLDYLESQQPSSPPYTTQEGENRDH